METIVEYMESSYCKEHAYMTNMWGVENIEYKKLKGKTTFTPGKHSIPPNF
jgi:hypothetical protein